MDFLQCRERRADERSGKVRELVPLTYLVVAGALPLWYSQIS